MDRLFRPWRMQYVAVAGHLDGCFLCAHPREERDADNLIVLRGVHAYIILNRYPYNTAHTLIAPYAHGGDFGQLAPETAAEVMTLTQRVVRALAAEYRPEGFNVGMNLGRVAGAGLPDHLHVHVVPRWGGDTNFMPVVGDTKVLPETLAQTYERLRARLLEE